MLGLPHLASTSLHQTECACPVELRLRLIEPLTWRALRAVARQPCPRYQHMLAGLAVLRRHAIAGYPAAHERAFVQIDHAMRSARLALTRDQQERVSRLVGQYSLPHHA